uniref:FAD-dependent oxidoreductase n=1 Tax=Eubacterium sp. TaxID=142586 RepID=UPI00402915F5
AFRRGKVDEAINIAQLKAFAADMDLNSDSYLPEKNAPTGKKIAIIGGGPAGLTAAYRLAISGHEVTVYDMMEKMGGMLRYGIPQYRLPKEVLDKEIAIIEKLGVKMINGVKLGKDFTVASLKAQNDAVIVAVGAWKSSSMRTPGEELDGIYGGIDFLRAVALKQEINIGDKVVICGGGNTAMDACRTAVRLGAKEVYCVYRRTRNEMPAEDIEITEAEEEGVQFKFLTNPTSFNGKDGKVKSVTLQLMELGEPDASGRRRPVAIEGKTEELDVDSVIVAIGQKLVNEDVSELKLTDRGNIEADIDSFKTNIEGVFAIGDATNRGASIAIEAIGEANRCALSIDAYLNGEDIETRVPYISRRDEELIDFQSKEKCPARKPQVLPAAERKNNFNEVCLGYTEEDAKAEASRCLECGCKEYYKCKLLSVAQRYDIHPERFKGEMPQKYTANSNEFIERNSAKCILCGLCVRSCKEVMNISAIGLLGRGFKTEVAPAFNLPLNQTKCTNCGLCVELCPTGALTEKSSLKKQVPLKEEYSKETVTINGKQAEVLVSRYDGKIIRVIPNDEVSRNSALSREELKSLIK